MRMLFITFLALVSITGKAATPKDCQVDVSLDPAVNLVTIYLYETTEAHPDNEFASRLLNLNTADKKCSELFSQLKDKKINIEPGTNMKHDLQVVQGCPWYKAKEKAIISLGQGLTNLFSTSGSIKNKSGKIEFNMSFQKEDQHFISRVIVNEASCVVEGFTSTAADEILLN